MTDQTINVKQLVKASFDATLDEFSNLTDRVIDLLRGEKNRVGEMKIIGRLIEMRPEFETTVIGDLHGDVETLSQILKISGFQQTSENTESSMLLFLGDYGDRGIFSPEVYHIVLTLKDMFPEHVILMRGNHEGPDDLQASPHDLPVHLHNRFGENWPASYAKLKELFGHLYNAVVVKDRCVLLHGGVPSQAKSLNDLAYAHVKHPQESHLEEILWSDPEENLKGTLPSPRGAGKLFGQDVTEKLLNMLKVKVLIRGHEPAEAGFKINHSGRVLTLFSRKGEPYFNSQGAFLKFDLAENIDDAFQLRRFVKSL
jgi:protein phosphatase